MVTKLDLLHIQWEINNILKSPHIEGEKHEGYCHIALLEALTPILKYFERFEVREKDAN